MTPSACKPLPDADARERAARTFDRNLVVLAGAGTGKTSLLVERMLNVVGSGEVGIDELAAITFTEKAAGEMRERLAIGLDRLRALARGEATEEQADEAARAYEFLRQTVASEQIAERALKAMELLDQASVVTIHGFCSQLLREHPIEAGLDPDFSVDSGEQAEALRHEDWKRFVARELGAEAPRPGLWTTLLEQAPLGLIGVLARGMADFGIPDSVLEASDAVVDASVVLGEELDREIAQLDHALEHSEGMTPATREYFELCRGAFAVLRQDGGPAFRSHVDGSATLQKWIQKNRPGFTKKLVLTREQFSAVSTSSHRFLKLAARMDDALMALLLEAVAPFVLEFREAFTRRGFVSFDGLLAKSRDLLRDHPEVRDRLKRRYRMLLVDEFQDTDPLQYEIVLLLAEKIGSSAVDAYDAKLEGGRLFIVGDAKQSIYRFRGADYSAYRRAVERIVEDDGLKLDLTTNFRSVAGVLDPTNRLFAADAGYWGISDYQPDYVPVTAVREQPDDGPRVELWTPRLQQKPLASDRREAEGRILAEAIHRLVEVEQVLPYERITILFRAFTALPHYLRPLRQWGIPFVVDGGREFFDRPEVHQLMATIRTLAQPADATALLAFLRSPAGGVSDVELADFAARGGKWDWRHDEPDSCSNVSTAFRLLRELSEETAHLPADGVVRRVVERTRLLPLGAAAFEGAQGVANLRKLAAAAAELAWDGKLSLEQVVDGLRDGRLADIERDAPVADDAAEAVRITNIHRMKGLENDWIFLPDIGRKPRGFQEESEAAKMIRLSDDHPALAMRAGGIVGAAWIRYELEQRRHEAAEEARVLYVALTRARERLVVFSSVTQGTPPWIEALEAWGYDATSPPDDETLLLDGLVRYRSLEPKGARKPPPVRVGEETDVAVEAYHQAVKMLRESARPPFASPSGLEEETSPAGEPRGRAAQREQGKAVGIVLHRWLERWDGGPTAPAELEALCESMSPGVDVDRAELLAEVQQIVSAVTDSELADRFREIEILGRELPLLLSDDVQRSFRGTIDLVYRDSDGEVVVADFKTDRDTDADSLRERYGGQIGVYAEAVRKAWRLDSDPRCELWVLRSGERVSLSGLD